MQADKLCDRTKCMLCMLSAPFASRVLQTKLTLHPPDHVYTAGFVF